MVEDIQDRYPIYCGEIATHPWLKSKSRLTASLENKSLDIGSSCDMGSHSTADSLKFSPIKSHVGSTNFHRTVNQ